MKNLLTIAALDIKESFRSRWFLLYLLIFSGLVAAFFITGVTDSRVLGFSGLSRLLLLFIQICIIILPVFVLVTTSKAILADRDLNILEYLLSFPISQAQYYYGKALGRLFGVFVPIFLSLLLAIVWGAIKGTGIPWAICLLYTGLLFSLCAAFLGIAFLICAVSKSQEMGLGLAFFVWLFCLAFLDLVLIGLLAKTGVNENLIFAIALANPMEDFRIAAISLFDPDLAVIGTTAYFILDHFRRGLFIAFSLLYPIALGAVSLILGYFIFRSKDLA